MGAAEFLAPSSNGEFRMRLNYSSCKRLFHSLPMLTLLRGIGLPLVCFTGWNIVVSLHGSGGGMFYAPTYIDEAIFFSAFVFTALPFLVVTLVLVYPMGMLVDILGISFTITVPVHHGTLRIHAAFVLAGSVGLLVQLCVLGYLSYASVLSREPRA
jgi:uncharacterized membrane protein YhdT